MESQPIKFWLREFNEFLVWVFASLLLSSYNSIMTLKKRLTQYTDSGG